MDPDFWIPYEGGHLPMKIIRVDMTSEGGTWGPREIEMNIRAVSIGPPVSGPISLPAGPTLEE